MFKDLLIGVTAFFREADAWEVLDKEVIAPLVRDKAPSETIRVWVAGCATGEEAYSIAMLLHEQMEAQHKNLGVQVFASDLDENAIKIARAATGRNGVIAFTGAYHGRTQYTLSLTGKVVPYSAGMGLMPGGVYRAQYPNAVHGVSVDEALADL